MLLLGASTVARSLCSRRRRCSFWGLGVIASQLPRHHYHWPSCLSRQQRGPCMEGSFLALSGHQPDQQWLLSGLCKETKVLMHAHACAVRKAWIVMCLTLPLGHYCLTLNNAG